MKIRVLGGGFYGCHIATSLLADGHDVELHEIADRIFAGASGACPARLHLGMHYPRSRLTRAACQDHVAEFMRRYGHMTIGVASNIYAIADRDSLVDFGTYCQVLKGEVEFIKIHDPAEFGLRNVEGAILTGERYICLQNFLEHFEAALGDAVRYCQPPGEIDSREWDWTIDCTFCANDAENIDRYEPCVTGILSGLDESRAVTIMDGPFPSVYPWGGDEGILHSITSASLTPLSKTCKTYAEAREVLEATSEAARRERVQQMVEQMAHYWPEVMRVATWGRLRQPMVSIRAMPRSGSDARLVDIVRAGERVLRVRAGKIDAIFHAERQIKEMIACSRSPDTEPQSSVNSPSSSRNQLAA